MENIRDRKIFRVGIYLRLSDEDRDKLDKFKSSESIKNQRYLLLEEIKKRENFVLVDEYVDENLSGAGTYRPQFERLINDCECGKLDIVLCKSQSRFSRDMEIIEKYLHNKFIEWNVRFISLSDYADTEIVGNKKARQINGLVNEWYLEDVSNNIRSAFRAKMLNGEYISPFAVFGYKIGELNNNKLVIDEFASEVVKKIYLLYLNGMGYLGITKYLNDNNIPSPSYYKYQMGINLNIVSKKPRDKIKWNASAVKSILTNEVYIGNLVQGKRTTVSYKNHKIKKKNKSDWIRVLNTHDAIIEKDIFYKVQSAIKERTKSSKNLGKIHVFSGMVFCFKCGEIMKKKNSSNHEYLVCANSQIGLCSNKKSIRYDKLESIVLNSLNELIGNHYNEKLLEKNFKNSNYINTKIDSLKKQKLLYSDKIKRIDFYLKNLYEDKVNGVISKEQFKNLVDNYERDNNFCDRQIKFIDEEIKEIKEKEKNITKNIFVKYKRIEKLNKIFVDEFIDKIFVDEILNDKRNIEIKWNF